MKKTVIIASGALIALSSTLSSYADQDGSTFYVNPAVGIQDFDSDRVLDNEELLSLGLEYRYGKHWAAEINVMDSNPEFRQSSSDLDLTQYGIDGIYYFNAGDQNKFEPYGVIGAGHADFDGNQFSQQETQARIGVGVRYALSQHWSLKADTRLLYGIDDDTRDGLLTIGLSYAFDGGRNTAPVPAKAMPADGDRDGVVDSLDQCLSTPMGVTVDASGCALDTDGDGVADYRDQCPGSPVGREVDDKGCKFVLKRTEEVSLNVVFATNSSVVAPESFAEIERVARFLSKYSNVDAVIEGHTDDTGAASYNESLSQRRADAVMKVLIERFNIAANRLSAKGYGESQPIASNQTREGRQANRRVVAVMKAEVSE